MLHENKDWPKSKKPCPETTFGSVLEVFLEPRSDIFAFFCVFEPSGFQSFFLMPKSMQTEQARGLGEIVSPPKSMRQHESLALSLSISLGTRQRGDQKRLRPGMRPGTVAD